MSVYMLEPLLVKPEVVTVARLGLKRYEQGKRCDINLLAPLYLRRSEAEERLEGCK
jgi:hypothetical protein